jgi:G6PDH family F420-dependent oxidoreductase
VTCPIFRYRPAVVAQTWASLSLLAPRRVFLGVGSGENLNEGAAGGGWASYEERASRLVEAVKIIRALWTGDHVRTKGQFWDVNGRLYDAPSSPIPLYIAAGGPKSARLAGRYGDGLITGAETLKDPSLKAAWEEGIREGRRVPSSEPIIVEHWAFVGGEKEAKEAANKWRFSPKAWEPGYFDKISPAEIQANAEKEIPLEKVLEQWTVSTVPSVHSEAIEKLADLGATHVVVHVASLHQKKVIDFFGRKVLPALRAG